MLPRINRVSSFLPITSPQTQRFHEVTHSFAQRQSAISFGINNFGTLSIVIGVVPHLPNTRCQARGTANSGCAADQCYAGRCAPASYAHGSHNPSCFHKLAPLVVSWLSFASS